MRPTRYKKIRRLFFPNNPPFSAKNFPRLIFHTFAKVLIFSTLRQTSTSMCNFEMFLLILCLETILFFVSRTFFMRIFTQKKTFWHCFAKCQLFFSRLRNFRYFFLIFFNITDFFICTKVGKIHWISLKRISRTFFLFYDFWFFFNTFVS